MNYSDMSVEELEALMLELQAAAEDIREQRIEVKKAWSAARARMRLAKLAGISEAVLESAPQELVDGLLALYSAREPEGSVRAEANTLAVSASAQDASDEATTETE